MSRSPPFWNSELGEVLAPLALPSVVAHEVAMTRRQIAKANHASLFIGLVSVFIWVRLGYLTES